MDAALDADWPVIPFIVTFVVGTFVLSGLVCAVFFFLASLGGRWMPTVEFLPDNGISRWVQVRRRVYVALVALAAIATIAGVGLSFATEIV
jgi:hypothetical protein